MIDYGFMNPFPRKYLTRKGQEASVILILTGANTLYIAYAITNVLAPAARLLLLICSPMYGIPFTMFSKSIPLK